jgi:hypothetical protein
MFSHRFWKSFRIARLGFRILPAAALFLLAGGAWAQMPASLYLTPVRFELEGYPGQRLFGTLRVGNVTDTPLPVAIEVEDFVPRGEEGRVVVGPDAGGGRSLTSWVKLAYQEFTVSPKQGFPLDFTVEIPGNAEPGTYYGTILGSPRARGSQTGSLIVTKVGALLLVDVYGDVREELSVEQFVAPRFAWKLPVPLAIRFKNTGTVREQPTGRIALYNTFGKLVVTVPIEEKNVLPGNIRRVEGMVSAGLLAGRYTARLEAAYGLSKPIPITAEKSFWFVNWRDAGLPSLILICTAVLVFIKRRNIAPAFRALRAGESRMAKTPPAPADEGKPPGVEIANVIKGRPPDALPSRAGRPQRMDL